MAEETKVGLLKNTVAAICYIPFIGWIAAIFFFLTEKEAFIKFHALQAIAFMVASWIAMMLLGLTIILAVFLPLLWVVVIVADLYMALQAYNGKEFVLPVIGKFVQDQLKKA